MPKRQIDRPGGVITLESTGSGPLIVCVPGMGESRTSFRHLTPRLVDAGYHVAVMDLRGHGESSTTFSAYDDAAAASDVLAVIDSFAAQNVAILGNSMGAAAAVLAATNRPDAVARLVLIGPFVRDHGPRLFQFALRILLLRPWGPRLWHGYYRSLFGHPVPEDHDEHVAQAFALLQRPGRWRAFQRTARTSHASAEVVLSRVTVPTLTIMGTNDPDFRSPESEASWVAEQTRGEYQMISGAGHYPMGEQPDRVADIIRDFLTSNEERRHG